MDDATKPAAAAPAEATTPAPASDAATTGDDWMTSMVNSVTGCCGVFDKASAGRTEDDTKTDGETKADAEVTTGDADKAAVAKTE